MVQLLTILSETPCSTSNSTMAANSLRAHRYLGIDSPLPTFATYSTSAATAERTRQKQLVPAESLVNTLPAKRKFTLKASIPTVRPKTENAAPFETEPLRSHPEVQPISHVTTELARLRAFLESKVRNIWELSVVKVVVASVRESFVLDTAEVLRYMCSYRFFPSMILPDATKRGVAYVLLDRPDHKYVLCSEW